MGITSENTFSHRAVRTWDAASGQPGRAWTSDPSLGLNVAINSDGKTLATMNNAGVIRLWDMETGKEKRPLPASPAALQAVSFQPDGKTLLTVGDDLMVRQWDAGTGRLLREPRTLIKDAEAEFLPGGKLLVRYQDKQNNLEKLRIEDAVSGNVLWNVVGHEAVLSADAKRLATSGTDELVHVFGLQTGIAKSWLAPKESDSVKAMRPKVRGFSGDGRFLILQSEVVAVWEVETDKQRTSWNLYRNKVLEMSEDKKPSKGKQPQAYPVRQIRSVAVSPDGTKIAFGQESSRSPGFGGGPHLHSGRLMILETATGKLLHQSEVEDGQAFFNCLAFSPDGKRVAAGGIGAVRVWEVGSGEGKLAFRGPARPHRGIGLQPGWQALGLSQQRQHRTGLGPRKVIKSAGTAGLEVEDHSPRDVGSSCWPSTALNLHANPERRHQLKETPMIRKLKTGEYRLYSRKTDPKTGKRKNLGTFESRAAAEKHERAVQYFKRA